MKNQSNQQPIATHGSQQSLGLHDTIRDARLIDLYASPEFQLVKAGFAEFEIPFHVVSEAMRLSCGQDGPSHVDIDLTQELKAKPNYFVHSYITPVLHQFIRESFGSQDFVSTKEQILEVYDRLSVASLNYWGAETMDDAELWKLFRDLVTFAYRISQVAVLTPADKYGLSFCIDGADGKELGLSGTSVCHIQFRLNQKEIFAAFDQLRAFFFWRHNDLNRYDAEILNHIREDYCKVAEQYFCQLRFPETPKSFTVAQPISLLAFMDSGITYRNYNLSAHSRFNLVVLMNDIKACVWRNSLGDAYAMTLLADQLTEDLTEFLAKNAVREQ